MAENTNLNLNIDWKSLYMLVNVDLQMVSKFIKTQTHPYKGAV